MRRHRAIQLGVGVLVSLSLASLAQAHGLPEEDKRMMVNGGCAAFIGLGAKHMLTGYDHLLFLFGVMFFLTRLRDVLKLITAFTLGHSITLLGATLLGFKANYDIIDAAIALTVCYKGFENLGGFRKLFDSESPNAFAMVLGFGLIHGLGLSTRLQAINLDGEGLAPKLLSFNLGVEVGQLVALSLIWMLLSLWRHRPSYRKFSTASNLGLVLAGSLLFLFNLHGYMHASFPADFPLNRAAHARAHQEEQEGVPLMPQEELILPTKEPPRSVPEEPQPARPVDHQMREQ